MARGSFGSNQGRGSNRSTYSAPRGRGGHRRGTPLSYYLGRISGEGWVDIVCLSLIGIFVIAALICWRGFSDALFYNILFPIIWTGSKIFIVAAIVIVLLWLLIFRFRRRWWW